MAQRRPSTEPFWQFCEALNGHRVDYIVIGSEAVAFYGVPRFSVDFDVFVRPTTANLFRVKAALEALGLGDLSELDPEVWAKSRALLRIGDPPLRSTSSCRSAASTTTPRRLARSMAHTAKSLCASWGATRSSRTRRPVAGPRISPTSICSHQTTWGGEARIGASINAPFHRRRPESRVRPVRARLPTPDSAPRPGSPWLDRAGAYRRCATGAIVHSPAVNRSPCINSLPSRSRGSPDRPVIRYSQLGSTMNHSGNSFKRT